ncbi:hypothetical protein CLV42_10559 [Chitinophaga ginsengisoli]|uniref:DUF4199 domain-containing protein n=2 Tax=Chitinophaga ginsengisoli TaxID=363837 RepID=A0A2P8G9Q0_9BACT|nr:hypothetical protein CLV42_10559 [Chitinophaga ginsengisoli]
MSPGKDISIITKVGAMIMGAVVTFIVSPPVINAEDNAGVDWRKIFVFVAGVLSIFLYDKLKNKQKLKKVAFFLVGLLMLLIIGYQLIYGQYSISCFDKARIVISKAPVKHEVASRFDYFLKHSQDPIHDFLEAQQCIPTKIWNLSDLVFPYYGLLALYLGIIITVILLVITVGDILRSPDASND